ncbi:MAG TPA: SDR family oxidoreductase [Herpetosiphonaceae bacterium]
MIQDAGRGRVALITGGSSGIGLASAAALLNDGYAVMLCARGEERLRQASEKLGNAERCAWHVADMAQPEQAQAAVEATRQRFGRLDALVVSHGVQPEPRSFLELTAQDWQQTLGVNLHGVIAVCQAAARVMVEQGAGGSIVTISSVNGLYPEATLAPYNVSKAAVIMLTKSIACELAPHGIRAHCLAPGWVVTPMTEAHYVPIAGRPLDNPLVGKIGQPDEIASWVAFLVGSGSSYATGEVIVVDGGQTTALSPVRLRRV